MKFTTFFYISQTTKITNQGQYSISTPQIIYKSILIRDTYHLFIISYKFSGFAIKRCNVLKTLRLIASSISHKNKKYFI